MDLLPSSITPETEALLQQHGGPLSLSGQQGEYVVMRSDVYQAMLGFNENDEVETLASVRRGLADMDAGRTQDLEEAFREFDDDHES